MQFAVRKVLLVANLKFFILSMCLQSFPENFCKTTKKDISPTSSPHTPICHSSAVVLCFESPKTIEGFPAKLVLLLPVSLRGAYFIHTSLASTEGCATFKESQTTLTPREGSKGGLEKSKSFLLWLFESCQIR